MSEEEVAVAKVAPAIFGATLYGLTLQDWVAIVTIAYVVLQAGLLVPKYWRMIREWRRGSRS